MQPQRYTTFCSTPPHTDRIDQIAIRAPQTSCRAALVCISTSQWFMVARTDKARQDAADKPASRDDGAATRHFLFHTTTHRPHRPNGNTSSSNKLCSCFDMYFNTSMVHGSAYRHGEAERWWQAGFAPRRHRDCTFCPTPPHTARNNKTTPQALLPSCGAALLGINTCLCVVVARTNMAR